MTSGTTRIVPPPGAARPAGFLPGFVVGLVAGFGGGARSMSMTAVK